MRIALLKYLIVLAAVLFAPCAAFAQETDEALAVQYFQNGEFEKAAPLFETLYNTAPTQRLYTYYFDCLMQLKDYKKAEKFVNRQIKREPDALRYMVDLGYVLLQSGDENAARKQFETAIKEVIPDRQGYVDISNAFLLRGQTDYAIKVLQKGKKTVVYDMPLNFELAEVYMNKGDFPSALNEYLELIDNSSEHLAEIESKLQDILSVDPDHQLNDLFRAELLGRLKKNPDKVRYSELLLWYFIQQKDFEAAFIQAKSLDRRQDEAGSRVYDLGRMAVSNQAWDAAISCFEYVIALGEGNPYWFSARVDLMDARYLKITSSLTYTQADLTQLEQEYKTALGSLGENAQTIPLMRNLAHLEAFYLKDIAQAKDLLNRAIAMTTAKPQSLALCKIELADILLMTGDVWEATLLYSQVEKAFKNDPLGAQAKFKNAKLSFYIGEFDWARAQLDVLKAATSKLIANDAMQLSLLISDNVDPDSSMTGLLMYARADLLVFMQKEDLAFQTLDSINTLGTFHPLFDEVLYKQAEIFIRKKDFTQALVLLKKLYDFYPQDILADDALFQMATIQEQAFNLTEEAMNLYKELFTNYPGSVFAVDARKRFRALRGDKVSP
jgi:tetratricopeptide (TPR) repeat protein